MAPRKQFLLRIDPELWGDVEKWAADELRSRGPELVLVTSAVAQADSLTMLAVSSAGAWQVTTPLLDRTFTGSGDLTAAMFLAHYLETRDPGIAVGRTADVVYSVLKATRDAGSSELLLVGAQDEIVNPSHHFEVLQIR